MTTTQIITIVDTETTGTEPPEHKLIEIAAVDLDVDSGQLLNARAELIFPGRDIPPDARAIHHISDADVIKADRAETVVPKILRSVPPQIAFAAHYAQFERQWLEAHTGPAWICTWKCALRLWPDAPGWSNQCLRYWLQDQGIIGDIKGPTQPVHRALPDAVVTAYILKAQLKIAPPRVLLEWSAQHALFPKLTFGKHKGHKWSDSEVPDSYLSWITDTSDMDDDVKWNARTELDRRRDVDGRAAAYVSTAKTALKLANTVKDLGQWWLDEEHARTQYGIHRHSTWHSELVKACAAHKQTILTTPLSTAPEPAPASQEG